MEGKRQAKISRMLQKELSEIFRKKAGLLGGVMVSVSAVRITPDLSIAKVYLSVFPSSRQEETMEAVNKQTKTIRYELARNVKEVLRKCPDLQFYIDDSLDYIENIDRLLASDRDKN